jgi:hypothetical protein
MAVWCLRRYKSIETERIHSVFIRNIKKTKVKTMSTFQKTIFFISVSLFLTSCDSAVVSYSKMEMKEACGKEDLECIAAVDSQYDACHAKYKNEWKAIDEARNSEVDKFMEIYATKLNACIVDKNGESFFSYDTSS